MSRKLELSCGLQSKLTHFPHTVTMEPKYIRADFKFLCRAYSIYVILIYIYIYMYLCGFATDAELNNSELRNKNRFLFFYLFSFLFLSLNGAVG